MNSPKITEAVANAMLDAGIGVVADLGKLRIYDGAQPTNGGDAIATQRLLVELTMNADAFPSASGALLTASGVTPAIAALSGTAAWFRLVKADGATVLLDGSVGTAGCDINLVSTTITVGQLIAVTSLTIADPRA